MQNKPRSAVGDSQLALGRSCRCGIALGICLSLLLALPTAPKLCAQVLSPPVHLAPTVAALAALQQCGRNISKKANRISSDILDYQEQLFYGLARGGYANQFAGGMAGLGRGGYQQNQNQYQREGEWLTVAPPKEYVTDLTHEAQWCLQVAEILNTDPARAEAAKQVLASIAKDLEIKVKDCKDWGAGRLVTVIANTVKNGQPDPGWTVVYKWVSVSGLNALELNFPQISTPTSKGVPPGVYSVYATKQVGNATVKTPPVTVSAFQNQKVKCEIPVP
jgi:hypothetical protein